MNPKSFEAGRPAVDAKAYQRIRQRLSLFHLAYTPFLLILSCFTLGAGFDAVSISQRPYFLKVELIFLMLSLFILILDFPISWYSGFYLEKKFNLSNQSFGQWALEFIKKSLLSFAFASLLVLGLYLLIQETGDLWWFWAWVGFSSVSYVMGKLFPVFIVPLFYKYGKVEDDELRNRIVVLANRFGMPVENVYSINLSKTTRKANAAFMGIGKTKRVVLSDTLISNFTHDEIEAVVGHELGHYCHKDIWRQLGFGLASSLTIFYILGVGMESLLIKLGYSGIEDSTAMPVLFMGFYAVSTLITPLQNMFSRMLERAADRFALDELKRPENFIACMRRLAEVNLADMEPSPVYEWFFYSHPAIAKRIRMAQEWKSVH